MSNSNLVNYTKISPNSSNPRNKSITKITIHHVAGNLSVETIGNVFAPVARKASSNYGVGSDGRVGMYVEEKNRAWTSSSADNDNQAVTIEVSNDQIGGDWHVSDIALAKTIDLCVDICKRNGIKKLNFTGDKSGNLTMHKWFAATNCPGQYLGSKFPYIADEVNKRLNPTVEKPATGSVLYRVQTGAFGNKANADTLLAKVKAAGFETYMVLSNGLYKVQVGAYGVKTNADATATKLKAKGFEVYITTEGGSAVSSSPSPTPVKTIQVGSKVKVKSGAKTYTGGGLSSSVYQNVYDVIEVKDNRIVIGIGKVITAAINKNDLILQ